MLEQVDGPKVVTLLLLDRLVDVAESKTLEHSFHASVTERHLGV
jgi:hypothetical protein